MHTQTLTGGWQVCQGGAHEWLPATVPGGIHTDLMAAGVIPDPFVSDNERSVQWVARADWRYKRTFNIEPGLLENDKVLLVADGLDTLATVMLNGQEVGRTDNMFRQYRWDVKPLLRPDAEIEIEVAFASPVKYVEEKQAVRA